MNRNLIFSFASLLLLTSSCTVNTDTSTSPSFSAPPPVTQLEQACGREWKVPLAKVKGTVKGEYYSYQGGKGLRGLHLQVVDSLSGRDVVIHVFPENCVRKNPEKFHFEVGQAISVIGSEFFTEAGSKRNICAARIDTLDSFLRDYNGTLNKTLCSEKAECQDICKGRCGAVPLPGMCFNRCVRSCEGR